MLENSRASSTNAVALVFHSFLLFGFIVVKPVVVCSKTLMMGILISAHSVPANSIPCPDPCIGYSSVFV